jgi:CBS domain containing-hemolysin-like protein
MYTLLIAFFLVSIIFSFLCSLWEAVLLSITPSYAEIKHQEGSPIGRQLRSFKANIDRPLAAILTLNTIAHTVGAIGVGAQATAIWSGSHPLITGLAVPATMTLAILVLSEIIPKTIGATYWKELAGFTVSSLLVIITILFPLVWLCQFITTRLKKDMKGSIYSRSDFLAMAEIGARAGVFEESESAIIANLLRFNKITAVDIMTPRTVVIAADEQTTVKSFFEDNRSLRFSRLPVYQEHTKDNVVGYFLKDELLAAIVDERGEELIGSIRREIMVIPEAFPLPELFNRFLERREHIALVVDEFGGMAGIVTMEDVIETLLGMEIVDESDKDVDMQLLARQNWESRARSHGLIEETPAEKDDTGDTEPDA